MLCACSGERERINFDEAPRSPDSLATRDFSASGFSSIAGDREAKLDINQHIDDVESALKEGISLNYEEARALLGRLEFQRGNFDAALQVFQGIDVPSLRPRMVKAIVERTRAGRLRSKVEILPVNLMSWHSISLLLEAIFLKSKCLEELGLLEDSVTQCKTIIDIVDSAWSNGIPLGLMVACKLKEMLHKALHLLPVLCKKAGLLEEAVSGYRRALTKPWDLEPQTLSSLQKDLAVALLYGGTEVPLPHDLQQQCGSPFPENNTGEAILLLFVLLEKATSLEISWDPEIMEHLTFALSVSSQFQSLAGCFELMLPGVVCRRDRWYLLALCSAAAGLTGSALNLIKKASGRSEKENKDHFQLLILGVKMCLKNHNDEGLCFAKRAFKCSIEQHKHHLVGIASHLLASCYRHSAKSSETSPERLEIERECLASLNGAEIMEKNDPEVLYSISLEHAVQRNHGLAKHYAIRYLDMMGGCSANGWRLLALIVSAEGSLEEGEAIVDISIDESVEGEHMHLLRMKALFQAAREDLKGAVETYRLLLTMIRERRGRQTWHDESEIKANQQLEMESWLDLASVYTKLGLWSDSNACLQKAKALEYFSPRAWLETANLFEAQAMHKDALVALSMSLSIEPDYAPSMVSAAALLRTLGARSLPIARSFLTNALRVDPMNHDAWMNLGFAAKREGSLQKAADCFQAAYELGMSAPVMSFL